MLVAIAGTPITNGLMVEYEPIFGQTEGLLGDELDFGNYNDPLVSDELR